MSDAAARQRYFDDGTPQDLWDWTEIHDNRVHLAWPCTHQCQHATQAEAERHFREVVQMRGEGVTARFPLVLPVLMVQSSAHRTTARLQRADTLRRVADFLDEAAGGGPLWNVDEIAAELRAAAEVRDG
jgi:hypothetical protein